MISAAIVRIVEFSRRHAAAVAFALFALAVAGGYWVSQRIAIDSDTGKLVDPNLPWQKASADLDRQFPQNQNLLVAVVDGKTPDQASDAAANLETALKKQPNLFQYVRRPDADPYLRRYGLLLLPTPQVQDFADHLIAAQPFLGTLAADPSARGVLGAMDLLALGALHGQADAARIDPPLNAMADAVEAAAAGRDQPLAWQNLLSGRKADPADLRHFVLMRPALNFGQVDAATQAIATLRADAKAAGLDEAHGVRVRVTGPVALNNDQLAVLAESATSSTVICFGLLALWLAAGVRSVRTLAAILLTLAAGLVGCAVFAVGCIGALNPVSIAFAPLFIGIAIDFGIQFSVRYAADRLVFPAAEAFRATAAGVGPPLAVAAVATAAGFLSFAPTAYLGVRDLGLIAGAGMLVALFLNLTLLPALLTLFKVGPERHAAGFSWGAALDRVLVRRRGRVVAISLVAAAGALAALPRLKLDFNPVDLEDPHVESVRTLLDLMADPATSPYTIEFLAAPGEAQKAAAELGRKPEVARVLHLGVFIPSDQGPKLDILSDAASLLGPTLNPATVKPAPTPAEILAAADACARDLDQAAAKGDHPAARLAAALHAIVREGPSAVPALEANLAAGIEHRLDDLRQVLQAGPVSLDTVPADFRRDWVAPDGRWRVQVFPSGDTRDNRVLRRFARTVESVVPSAVGSAVAVDEFSRLAPRAFATAGLLALAAIAILLFVVLRRLREVGLVLVPLVLAGVVTLGAAALLGYSINFANIITLPMMLGIGVAFDIYFVMRRRSGEPGLLSSPTARGVVFSALTTGTAFGSLALSRSPGMAEMGKFLSLALFFILLSTLFVLPALLGRPDAAGKEGRP